jgi:hypothetical protein
VNQAAFDAKYPGLVALDEAVRLIGELAAYNYTTGSKRGLVNWAADDLPGRLHSLHTRIRA